MRFCYFGIYDSDFSRNRIYMSALKTAGHEIVECRDTARGLWKYVRLAYRLMTLTGSYDALIVGYPGHAVVPVARIFGSPPVIVDLLGSLSDAASLSHGAGWFSRLRLRLVDLLAIKSAHIVLVETEAQKEYLQSQFGSAEKYRVVYTGADESIFGLRPEKNKSQTEPFTVMFRGSLTPESGIMHVLDAAEQLLGDASIAFRIVGRGRLLGDVERRIQERGLRNVELLSDKISFEKMVLLMADADVSLGQFADNERLSRTIPHKAFESMSMGIPYITARAKGVLELLEDDVSCLMVSIASGREIVDAIRRLKANPSLGRRLALQARRVFESRVSQKEIAEKISSAVQTYTQSTVAASLIPKIHVREVGVLSIVLLLFICIRIPGLNLPFHQDENKLAEIAYSQIAGALAGHPPLTEFIYRIGGRITGAEHLRLIPLFFAAFSAVLLYFVMRRRAGVQAATWSLFLYAVCAYGVLASVMVDTDGAILPTLFLLSVYAYDRWYDPVALRNRYRWLFVAVSALVLGLLTKLSFILVLGTLILDYLIAMRRTLTRGLIVGAAAVFSGCIAIAAILIVATHFFVPSFDVSKTIEHALYYVRFEGRGYLQILIQTVKALFYLSPLLIFPLILTSKDDVKKNRVFLLYLGLGAIFYFVLFDFSQGALDKYLMYSIVPFAAIAGTVLARTLSKCKRTGVLLGALIGTAASAFLLSLNTLSPHVMPLYPKTAWLSAIVSGNWNILLPFTGGSGPLGFYLSFLVIAAGFFLSAGFILGARYIPRIRIVLLIALIVVGVTYNGIFIEELLFGNINGSAPQVLRAGLAYIAQSNASEILTHADAGAFELKRMGKYAGRFYAVPQYEEGHKALFAKFHGEYLVVDMPQWNTNSFYAGFFAACTSVFSSSSGRVTVHVYACPEK